MTKEEIQHLGTLSRIKLSEAEVTKFQTEIDAVLGYVSAINEIVADNSLTKTVGAVHNVFRSDEVTNQPGTYTDLITKAFPKSSGPYLKVKKILNPDN
jgi:aspartyl-tRNA(Asn)/glutamyl-tRNA(Gln) amidotransferase subunit C